MTETRWRHWSGALSLAALLLTAASAACETAPESPKNLQVLPKTMSILEVKSRMMGVAKSLGVKCGFCHDIKNFASDDNPHKEKARSMFRMVAALNRDHFQYEGAPQVTCFTCHRGAEEPLFEPAAATGDAKGAPSP